MARDAAAHNQPPAYASDQEKGLSGAGSGSDGAKKDVLGGDGPVARVSLSSGSGVPSRDATHRKLKSRHIQLIGIGGTIGTALYVSRHQLPLSHSLAPS